MSLKQISLVWGTLRNQKSSQVILDETNEDISNKQTNKQTVNANTPSRNTDRPKNVKGVQCLTFITPRQAQKNRILTIYGEFLWAVLLWLLEVCPFICIDKLLKMHDSHKTSTGWKATKRSQCVLKVFDILSVATSQFSLKVRYIYIYILFCIENVYWWFHLHWSQMPVHVFSPCWELKLRHPFPWTKNMAPQNVQKTTVNECKCHWLWCKGPQGGTASASWTIEMQLEVSAFMS